MEEMDVIVGIVVIVVLGGLAYKFFKGRDDSDSNGSGPGPEPDPDPSEPEK